ncbi:MAG: aminoacyl-tRNA hydrolase [Chloroflexi bacterium]|nr:aminoacyl-tRNA hydrolase [Chloroflexota bacterium]
MKIVVGLGNVGARYANTRHNAGFLCVDALARAHGLRFVERRFDAELARGTITGEPVVLAKPQTFMNLSGRAVRPLLNWYKLDPKDLLIVADDLDLEFGRLRLRPRGSAGGQRGIESIIAALGTQEVSRLRIGIGRPPPKWDPADYVLLPLTPSERAEFDKAVERAAAAVECWIERGVDAAMNEFNRAAS